MTKSATDVMGEIVLSAVIDAAGGFKAAARGVPNALARDLSAVHPNTTLGDLPAEVRAAIAGSVRAAFTRLLKEGYAVTPAVGGTRPPGGPRPPGGTRPSAPPRTRGPAKPPVVETKRRPGAGPRGPKTPIPPKGE